MSDQVISISSQTMGGTPVFAGTRLPVKRSRAGAAPHVESHPFDFHADSEFFQPAVNQEVALFQLGEHCLRIESFLRRDNARCFGKSGTGTIFPIYSRTY
jgi:hypothetical protein